MPLQACIKCYRVWEARKVMLSLEDLENLRRHNQTYVICKECSDNGREQSVLKDEEGNFE